METNASYGPARGQTKTLVFGIGAARSGTTWLYQYLKNHDQCFFRFPKELHYFDFASDNADNWRTEALMKKVRIIKKRSRISDQTVRAAAQLELNDLYDWLPVFQEKPPNLGNYLTFLTSGLTNERVFGDITPAYANLSEKDFSKMNRLHEDTRFIYILRNPIDRLSSHVRLVAKR
ncbi:MAG: sulfotransferase, partial [Alphaproteobacteria bacterium]|nr:sulfotransferase [Alphaproteobacteria bacterium]